LAGVGPDVHSILVPQEVERAALILELAEFVEALVAVRDVVDGILRLIIDYNGEDV